MSKQNDRPKIRSTTIVAVKRDNTVALAGDGQVSLEHTVMKHNALSSEDVVSSFSFSIGRTENENRYL